MANAAVVCHLFLKIFGSQSAVLIVLGPTKYRQQTKKPIKSRRRTPSGLFYINYIPWLRVDWKTCKEIYCKLWWIVEKIARWIFQDLYYYQQYEFPFKILLESFKFTLKILNWNSNCPFDAVWYPCLTPVLYPLVCAIGREFWTMCF